jgi:hypothetical protein
MGGRDGHRLRSYSAHGQQHRSEIGTRSARARVSSLSRTCQRRNFGARQASGILHDYSTDVRQTHRFSLHKTEKRGAHMVSVLSAHQSDVFFTLLI